MDRCLGNTTRRRVQCLVEPPRTISSLARDLCGVYLCFATGRLLRSSPCWRRHCRDRFHRMAAARSLYCSVIVAKGQRTQGYRLVELEIRLPTVFHQRKRGRLKKQNEMSTGATTFYFVKASKRLQSLQARSAKLQLFTFKAECYIYNGAKHCTP